MCRPNERRRHRRRPMALLLMPVLAVIVGASPVQAQAPVDARAFAAVLDRTVPQLLDSLRVPGTAVALIRDGAVVWTRGYGFADVERQLPVSAATVFQVASISKAVAAWGVLRLVERGAIELDAPVSRYVTRWRLPQPESAAIDVDSVTVRRLLSHTAGLSLSGYPGFDPDSGALPTLEESLSGRTNGAGAVRVILRPGTRWQYSGGGYTLLQLMIEERTGRSFAAYMRDEVLRPLGMESSAYAWEPALREHTAAAYDRAGGRRLPNYVFTAQAAAGLYTTIDDLARWVAAGMAGRGGAMPGRGVLATSSIALMHSPAPSAVAPFGRYGLGHIIDTLSNGRTTVSHTGGNRGWRSIFITLPDTRDGLVVLTNSNTGAALHTRISCMWLREVADATRRGCAAPPR